MKPSVLMLAENPIPASTRVSRPHYLAEALGRAGFAVRTITFQAEQGVPIPGCKHIYLPVPFKQFGMLRRGVFALSIFYVSLAVLRSRPAVLHGQGFLPGLIVLLCARAFRLPCVVGMPDFAEVLYKSFRFPFANTLSRLVAALENAVARHVDALVVESDLAKAEWCKRGVDPDRVHPIHHAADTCLFDPAVPGNRVREAYGLGGRMLITYHGDIGGDDGVDLLIRAFRTIAERHPTATLMVIGSGARATMDELAELSKGLKGRVVFTGWVPYRDVPHYLAASDIGVAPFRSTLYTNSVVPTKVLETMAMCKPAVVSNLRTFSQYVRHGQHCLLVEPGSVEQLASALSTLIENPGLRRVLGENGRQLVEKSFTWTVKTGEEIQVIQSLVG
jgi:glycosyltransferase involved in cell wall biosynthesis